MSHTMRWRSDPLFRALATLVLLAPSACGDDTSPRPDDTGTLADAEDIAEHDVTDAADDTDADTVAAPDTPDAEHDADADASETTGPACDPPLRAVGEYCRKPVDRVCLEDGHCRPTETCVIVGDEPLGTCTYTVAPPRVCPGSEGCAATADPEFRAAFGARDVTPVGWELARPGYSRDINELGLARAFIGDVEDPNTFCDCGRDLICPPTPEYDDCVSLGEWTGPDADGTEGDGRMQGNWMAGFNNNWNANLCPDEWLDESCEGAHCCDAKTHHDPLWVRGAVLDYGETRVAFLTIDAVGYFYGDILRHAEALPEEWGIDLLFMGSTHNHQGTDTMGRWGPGILGDSLPTTTGRVGPWLDEVHDAVVELIGDCVERLEPADVYVGQIKTPGLEFALSDYRDPFVIADLLTAVRVVRAGETPGPETTLGVWVNWHNHVESLGGGNRIISSDFPHWMRLGLEQGLSAGADERFPAREPVGGVSVFIPGAVGGLMNPLSRPVVSRDGVTIDDNGYEKARAIGERLADVVWLLLSTPCADGESGAGCYRQVEPTLEFATVERLFDVENFEFQLAAINLDLFEREVYNWRFSDGSGLRSTRVPKLLTNMTQLRIGGVTFQSVPGEAFPETFTGFDFANIADVAEVGRPHDVACAEDRVTRISDGSGDGSGEALYPCAVRADNEAPPDLSLAPEGPGLFETIPGNPVIVVGNGMDSVGYLVPSYDFVVDPVYNVFVESPGDHYEEGVSVGDVDGIIRDTIDALSDALDTE